MALLDRLRKGVKKKKAKTKSKQLRRRQKRQQRREKVQAKKEAVADIGSDLGELAAATRPGEAVTGTARAAKKAGKAGITGLERADDAIDKLGIAPPDEDFVSGDSGRQSRPQEVDFMGGSRKSTKKKDDEFRFI